MAGWRVGAALAATGAVVAGAALWLPARTRVGRALALRAGSADRRREIAGACAAAAAIGCCFATSASVHAYSTALSPLAGLAEGRSVAVTAALTADPQPLASSGFGPDRVLVRATLREVRIGRDRIVTGGAIVILAPAQHWSGLLPGQRVKVRGEVSPPTRHDLTVAVLRTNSAPISVSAPSTLQAVAGTVRARFADAAARALPDDAAGLLPALVVGDTSRLPQSVRSDFTTAGLAHLTAVSGTNVSILLGAVLLMVRAAALGPRAGAAVGALVLALFVVLARPSPSVLRAAAMGAIGLLALLTGRRKQAMPALAAAVIVLIGLRPNLAVDFGFALSVAATAALIVLVPGWTDRLCARGVPLPLAQAIAVATAAFVATAPIVAAMSGTVSPVAIAANLLVSVSVLPITVLGALAAAGAAIWLPLGVLVAHTAGPPLWWLLLVARLAARMPGATLPVPGGLVGAVLGIVGVVAVAAILRSRGARAVMGAVLVGAAVVLVPLRMHPLGWPPPGWIVVACDVGQGDGLVLRAGGSVVVVDVGPAGHAMAQCLNRLRVRRIELVVLSHLHADHIGAIADVLHAKPVAAVAIGPMRYPADGFAAVQAAASASGTPIVELTAGDHVPAGNLVLRVLGPMLPAPADPGDGDEAANNQSLVLAVDGPAGRILLPGDAETAALDALRRSGVELRADVLKVPHHGSRTTPATFLDAVRPRIGLVSVGADNTFGHPAPSIVDRLHATGTVVARTDRSGDIAVVADRRGLSVVARGDPVAVGSSD
ncbi:ComEC/Rec2 family competence protein [Aldersonia sp. NBC_00410]|uniref:ComEC/Rec2 family competence protein n=1 Tax=Aldersonia sp. NBC_00410 TaxID=2975954 RepID=UPI0022596F5C|nr:ComEC/Rec2 family competence protein [Aldersonia sp. NBC_00410]MCX5042760.1 ComEC/Rec2 family competence protein [Aldersonia sp. NBC_00410]